MSTIEVPTVGFHNASVFLDGRRIYQSVHVDVGGSTVTAHRPNGDMARSWEIVEIAKEGMAWDALDESGTRVRVVVQTGCGCSGMLHYDPDPGYSGTLTHR